MRSLRIVVTVVLTLITALVAQPAYAATVTNGHLATIDCTGFFGGGALITYDRDNTGIGHEARTYMGRDGAGNLILNNTLPVWPVGLTIPIGNYLWGPAPLFNPITVTLISDAGNGLPQQTVYVWTGNCPGLPTAPQPSAGSNVPIIPPTTWFDPGDTRVDGWAGDRLAVYCRDNKRIQVIGIGPNGKAAGYALFNVAEVIAAGQPGRSAALRSYHPDAKVNLGVVSIQMALHDGVTSVYIAWNGGILNATGLGDFKKQFLTPIRFCPYTFR